MRGLLAVPYSEAARGSSPERKKNHPLGSAQHHLPCDDEDEDDDGDYDDGDDDGDEEDGEGEGGDGGG